jgi:DNA polymerase elongation subunit (family B)
MKLGRKEWETQLRHPDTVKGINVKYLNVVRRNWVRIPRNTQAKLVKKFPKQG